jgi:hypothetical protein
VKLRQPLDWVSITITARAHASVCHHEPEQVLEVGKLAAVTEIEPTVSG